MELYRAVDTMDGMVSLFLVEGGMMAVSTGSGSSDQWLDKESMVFDDWVCEPLDWGRMPERERVW